ncbi:MAG: hypothetical protein ACXQT5_07630 [Candidatus Syntropharchaeia archaeon]
MIEKIIRERKVGLAIILASVVGLFVAGTFLLMMEKEPYSNLYIIPDLRKKKLYTCQITSIFL